MELGKSFATHGAGRHWGRSRTALLGRAHAGALLQACLVGLRPASSDRRDSPEWELMMGCDLISLGGSSSIIGNAKDCCVFLFCLVTARKPWVVDGGKFPLCDFTK